MRPLDSLAARALPGTEDAGRPFWSPDSKALAFVGGGKLKRIDVGGGDPITLCDARSGRGGSWNEDGVILFGDQLAGVQRIHASGGTPSPVTRFSQEAGDQAHYYPQFLPGGKEFLYLARHRESEKTGIFVGPLDGKPATRILQTEYKALHDAVTGRLLYIQGNGTLMARRLESDPPRLTGDPAVVAEEVGLASNNAFAEFSVSGTGTLFYGRVRKAGKMRFAWWDRAGKPLETIGQPLENGGQFRMSPDGSRVAYNDGASRRDVWVMELPRGLSTRITFTNAQGARWSPDGKYLYYLTRRSRNQKGRIMMSAWASNF